MANVCIAWKTKPNYYVYEKKQLYNLYEVLASITNFYGLNFCNSTLSNRSFSFFFSPKFILLLEPEHRVLLSNILTRCDNRHKYVFSIWSYCTVHIHLKRNSPFYRRISYFFATYVCKLYCEMFGTLVFFCKKNKNTCTHALLDI